MDFALALAVPLGNSADLALTPVGDIALDATLTTSVIISLLTDRLADSDDVIPDGSTNRRGWWGDAYAMPLPDGTPFLWGSKLWLRQRCTATPENARLIQDDCNEALAWMVATGIAGSVEVATQWISATGLLITIVINQPGPGNAVPLTFAAVWSATLGTLSPAPAA